MFTLASSDLTCRASNSGTLKITATEPLEYTVYVLNKGIGKYYNFNKTLTIENLSAGIYDVCITVRNEPTYRQCFSINIKEPEDLSVYSSVNPNSPSLLLQLSGGDLYFIELNVLSSTV